MISRLLPALLVLMAPLSPLLAQGNAQATVEARQANFKSIARANKGVQDELRKSSPAIAVLRTNAADLQAASERIAGFFPAGTGPDTGIKMEALPAIWQNPKGFTEAADRHVAAVRALNAAVAGGDMARIRAAADAIGPTCKNCHDSFRLAK